MVTRSLTLALILTVLSAAACTKTLPMAPSNPIPIVISGTVRDTLEMPLAGVVIRAQGVTVTVEGLSDSSGRFALPGIAAESLTHIRLSAELAGYARIVRLLDVPALNHFLNLKLPVLGSLPIDSTASGQLLPSDLADYIGEPYDSDYSWNTKYFSFSTPSDADVSVELTWERTGNASLKMWQQNTLVVSESSGDRQVIRLPRNTNGVLLVGQPFEAYQLTSAANFTLEARRITNGNDR